MEHKVRTNFNKEFLWGAASAAFQTEGAYKENGKGLSIQDVKNGTTKFHDTSVTSDFYHRYHEDILLMKEMGLKSFRLSIAWTRIYPDGETQNENGIDFYNRVIDDLLEHGIEPLVTLYHFDHPAVLQEQFGGWYDRAMIDKFLLFSETCFQMYGDRVKYWLTICEQNNVVLYPNLIGGIPQGVDPEQWRFQVTHVMSLASAKAIELCHTMLPEAKIGPCIGYAPSYPASSHPNDVLAAMNEDDFRTFYPLDLACLGRRNPMVIDYLKDRNIAATFTNEELACMQKGKPDFIAFNYYQSHVAKHCPLQQEEIQPEFNLEGKKGGMTYPVFPGLYQGDKNPYLERNDWDWEIDPIGLRIAFRRLYDRFRLPLMITENGLGAFDVLEDGSIHDNYRIDYLKKHIEQMKEALTDGIPILGYYPWSFTDLLSTSNGFGKRYGFVYIDRTDEDVKELKRYKKDSFYWYKKLIQSNGEEI